MINCTCLSLKTVFTTNLLVFILNQDRCEMSAKVYNYLKVSIEKIKNNIIQYNNCANPPN